MHLAPERNVVEFVRDFARDLIAIIFSRCCSQEPIPDERGREVGVVVLERRSHIISRNDARASRVIYVLSDLMDLSGKSSRKATVTRPFASLRFLPRFRGTSFLSLSLSLFCRACRTDASNNQVSRGFSFPFPFPRESLLSLPPLLLPLAFGLVFPAGRTSATPRGVAFRPRRRETKFCWQQRC